MRIPGWCKSFSISLNVVESPLMGGIRCLDSGDLRLIPYYSWDNRDACEMKVWLPYGL